MLLNSEAITEDVSVPTLTNRFRLLVLPRKLRRILPSKSYRTRGSERSLDRTIGNLKGFVNLPMELVLETAIYLSPKDLLHLSRLSKQFRSIFTSRSAIFIWRTVFHNSNIKCPADINELQFTSLVYDKFCMACTRVVRCELFTTLRLRLCPSCQTENLVSTHDLKNQYPNAWDFICFLPTWPSHWFKPEAQLLIEKFLSLRKENTPEFIANVGEHTMTRRGGNDAILSITNTQIFRRRQGRVKQSCRGYGARR